MGYIYILTSPSGKSYIGQTTRPIEERFKKHQQYSKCTAIYRAMKKYGWDNFKKDYYECPDEDLNFDEELLIREMGTMAPDGYNLKGGGNNAKMSEETKQRMSESQHGKTMSEESKQKMSEARLGKPHGEEHKKNMREAKRGENNPMYGKTHGEETRRKISETQSGEKNHMSKKVYQYALDGTFIDSFVSTEEAGRRLKKAGSLISRCARGAKGCKIAYGFKWSYIKF